jgi:hypothetical protein
VSPSRRALSWGWGARPRLPDRIGLWMLSDSALKNLGNLRRLIISVGISCEARTSHG